MTELAQRDASPDHIKRVKRPPFNQKIRINVFRAFAIVLFPPALFIRPYFDDPLLGEFLKLAGTILIIACVVGRCWAILYVGGNKNEGLVTTGPYSLCRNPLYLFSIMGVLGIGLMLQSLVYTVLLTSVTLLVLTKTVRQEEAYLSDAFAENYVAYRNGTPRFITVKFRKFQTEPSVNVSVRALKRCFWDSALFFLAIPVLELFELLHEVNAVASFVLF